MGRRPCRQRTVRPDRQNNNGIFDIEEAADSFVDYDVSMDLDAGGHIERHEFTLATFNHYDVNDNGNLDTTEFMQFSREAEVTNLLSSR